MTTVICIFRGPEGSFVEAAADARVSILDRGYLLGDGVFATMRGYDGICFRPQAHLAEIARGAEMLGIPVPAPLEKIAALGDEAARRTGATNAYVRVTLTHGPTDGEPPTLSIIARPMLDVPSNADYTHGVATVTVTPRRIPPACLDGTIKLTSYAAAVLARREVAQRGAGEGIQLAVDGSLACGTMSSLFVVMGNTLLAPSLESGCRAGVTRAALLELAPSLGLAIREERLDPSLLAEADEAFLASTRVECLPIASVDGRTIGHRKSKSPSTSGAFERAHALRKALVALVRKETAARGREAAASPRAQMRRVREVPT